MFAISRAYDLLQHALGIPQHVMIPETENKIAHRFEQLGPIRVTRFVLIVLSTIKLYDEFGVRAGKVDHKPIDRYLSFEFQSGEAAIAQPKP